MKDWKVIHQLETDLRAVRHFFSLFKSVAFFIRKYGWNEFSVKQTFRLFFFFGRNSEMGVTVL